MRKNIAEKFKEIEKEIQRLKCYHKTMKYECIWGTYIAVCSDCGQERLFANKLEWAKDKEAYFNSCYTGAKIELENEEYKHGKGRDTN